MFDGAAVRGWIVRKVVVLEFLFAFKRAGADFILTYHATEVAEWLNER